MSITVRLFASLRERLGTGREELDASAVDTVADAWAAITAEPFSGNVLAAINHEYVGADTAVHDGDEVAFFPARHWGLTMRVEVTDGPFDPWAEVGAYERSLRQAGKFGATAVFVGTMRDCNEGDTVRSMSLEHYPGMTERSLRDIAAEVAAQHGLLDVLIVHRAGTLHPAEPIVLVATWSAHRAAAFASCREIMEHLKARAPFWKKETLAQGQRWVEKNTPG